MSVAYEILVRCVQPEHNVPDIVNGEVNENHGRTRVVRENNNSIGSIYIWSWKTRCRPCFCLQGKKSLNEGGLPVFVIPNLLQIPSTDILAVDTLHSWK